MELAAPPSPLATAAVPKKAQLAALPFTSLEKWRAQRPAMPPARTGPALAPAALYERIAPSIYIVLASEHAIELAERTAHAQGSAVAITDRILLTNCHVVEGRPQISLTQQGQTGRASLIYADPGGDRCFLRSDDFPVHPIQGVRRFEDLRVGEQVFSIGTPIGLELSYGEGMISGLRQYEGVRMVQNSAPTWHGSSGGGLFDDHGNLVGITTAISNTIPNLNFSIAAEDFWP
jgi:S1-C subfamily serine protease